MTRLGHQHGKEWKLHYGKILILIIFIHDSQNNSGTPNQVASGLRKLLCSTYST